MCTPIRTSVIGADFANLDDVDDGEDVGHRIGCHADSNQHLVIITSAISIIVWQWIPFRWGQNAPVWKGSKEVTERSFKVLQLVVLFMVVKWLMIAVGKDILGVRRFFSPRFCRSEGQGRTRYKNGQLHNYGN